jgi:hypothetical protein
VLGWIADAIHGVLNGLDNSNDLDGIRSAKTRKWFWPPRLT